MEWRPTKLFWGGSAGINTTVKRVASHLELMKYFDEQLAVARRQTTSLGKDHLPLSPGDIVHMHLYDKNIDGGSRCFQQST